MVASCSHWIWPAGEDHANISATDRLRVVTSSLSSLEPCPSLVIVFGSHHGIGALPRPKRQPGRLCLDLYSEESTKLLIGTTALRRKSGNSKRCCVSRRKCHPAAGENATDARTLIFSSLLYPLVDVFCFYSYGYTDLSNIAVEVASWMQRIRGDARPHNLPHLLIILAGIQQKRPSAETEASVRFHSALKKLIEKPLATCFSNFDIKLESTEDSSHNVQSIISQRAETVRQQNGKERLLFSVRHFNSLFERGLTLVSKSPLKPFDMIQAARQDFPVSPNLATHVSNFLRILPLTTELRTFAVEVIASALLMDHYPPGMHCMNPGLVARVAVN